MPDVTPEQPAERRGANYQPQSEDLIMAYMSQEKKARIAAELKQVMPKGWKYSLAVRHHSTIVLTISAAPIDLIAQQKPSPYRNPAHKYEDINDRNLSLHFEGDLLETFEKIKGALNVGNHDNSDPMTDYFDVGHYVDITIGRWNKPFEVRQ